MNNKEKEELKILLTNRLTFNEELKKKGINERLKASGYYILEEINELTFQGAAVYLIYKDIDILRKNFKKIGLVCVDMLNLYDVDKLISPSCVTMLKYQELLLVLVAADFDLAREFAEKIGGRFSIEKSYDHPFDRAFGYCLKYLVLNEKDLFLEYYENLCIQCEKSSGKIFMPYAKVMKAIMDLDDDSMNEAYGEVRKTYKRKLRRDHPGWDYWPNFWGIGLANLAIHRGMKVEVDDEYMPRDLLIND